MVVLSLNDHRHVMDFSVGNHGRRRLYCFRYELISPIDGLILRLSSYGLVLQWQLNRQ